MNATDRADAIVAHRLRRAAATETLPGTATGTTAADLAATLAAGTTHADRFTAEIRAAVTGTAWALDAARTHPRDPWAAAAAAHPDPTAWFEQAVLLGHPTHPLARTRGTLTHEQARAYAPEHRPRLTIGLHRLPGLHTHGAWPWHDDHGPLLPVHPWQAAHLDLPPATTRLDHCAPLMSLRTLTTGDHHIKTAVSLQLTSAIRHVSAAAAANGPRLAPVLARRAAPHAITVLDETAAIVHDHTGPRPDLAAITRPAPHTLGHHRAVPLAALAEPCPTTGRPLAAAIATGDLHTWWHTLIPFLLAPLRLLAATGAALEAHGQNTLVTFDHDRPTGLLYRDLGGLRIPTTGWPTLTGDLHSDDPHERTRKLLAALLPTTLTALVTALATWTATDHHRWWHPITDHLHTLDLPTDMATAVLHHPWPAKATTAMRLSDHPHTDQWTTVDNPLAAP